MPEEDRPNPDLRVPLDRQKRDGHEAALGTHGRDGAPGEEEEGGGGGREEETTLPPGVSSDALLPWGGSTEAVAGAGAAVARPKAGGKEVAGGEGGGVRSKSRPRMGAGWGTWRLMTSSKMEGPPSLQYIRSAPVISSRSVSAVGVRRWAPWRMHSRWNSGCSARIHRNSCRLTRWSLHMRVCQIRGATSNHGVWDSNPRYRCVPFL